MIRIATIASLLVFFAGCERSTRVIEPPPKTDKDNVRPDENPTPGGDALTNAGKLQLEVSGFPQNASSVDLKISINGSIENRTVSLQAGSGSDIFGPLEIGATTVKIQALVSGSSYEGSAKVTVRARETSRVSINVTSNGGSTQTPGGSAPTPGGPAPAPTPGGNAPSPTGESDAEISIDIGGSGTSGSSQQNLWDGKSFKGNSMFSIEPVN